MTPPPGLGEANLVAFSTGPARAPSLVLAYDDLAPGDTIDGRMKELIAQIRRTNPEVTVGPVHHRRVGGRTAAQMTARWFVSEGLVEQTSVFVVPGADDPRRLTMLVFTAPEGTGAGLLERLLATVTFPAAPEQLAPEPRRQAPSPPVWTPPYDAPRTRT
jgi:hypothetical protein